MHLKIKQLNENGAKLSSQMHVSNILSQTELHRITLKTISISIQQCKCFHRKNILSTHQLIFILYIFP